MVGRDVADAVAAGLDGVHLDAGELGQDVGHVLERRPVELQVLARGEVAVAAVVLARDVRQLAQLPRRQQPVGNGDAQHRRVALDVQAVPQAQRPELVLGELAGEKAPRLVAELRDALVDDGAGRCRRRRYMSGRRQRHGGASGRRQRGGRGRAAPRPPRRRRRPGLRELEPHQHTRQAEADDPYVKAHADAAERFGVEPPDGIRAERNADEHARHDPRSDMDRLAR